MTITVNKTDTFEEWRVKSNQLGVALEDLSNNVFTQNVIASGNITATGNITTFSNLIVSQNVTVTGNISAANVNANVNYATHITDKPSVNVKFTGDVTGIANVHLLNKNTNAIDVALTIQPNSVALGTDTTGDYVQSISSADNANIIINSGSGESSTPTVNLGLTGVTRGSYGNANVIAQVTVDTSGRLTSASNVEINRAYYLTTNKPSVNINFTGDVTGKANVNLANENTNAIDVSLTVQPNSVALGTDTTGDYVQSISSADTANIVVNSGSGESSTPTLNLGLTGVTRGSYGNANVVAQVTVDTSGRLTSASNVAIDRSYYLTANKPSVNVNFTGDVTGKANVNLANENTNAIDVALTIQPNSVALGTDTTGDYVASISSASLSNIIINSGSGEASTPTVDLAMTTVAPGTVGTANAVPVITIKRDGRIYGAFETPIDRAYYLTANKPSVNINFTGDVTGKANVNLANENTNAIDVSLTVQPNSVALGTDTTGNYVSTVTVGSGLTVSGTADEGNVVTVAHADTSSVTNVAVDNSDGTVLQDVSLSFDGFGHVTGASVSSVDLDNRFVRLSTATVQTITGPITFQSNVAFLGNVVTISANNLTVSDNFIYLNSGNTTNNVDLGFSGSYNDGVYKHAGFFRDASDGYFKVFDNYLVEPEWAINIDTGDASYREANFKANVISAKQLSLTQIDGNSIVATGNIVVNNKIVSSSGALFWNSLNDGSGSTLDADLLDGQEGTYYLDYTNTSNKPSVNVTFTGDVTGAGNVTLSATNTNLLSIALDLSETGVAAATYGNANVVAQITVDAEGRVTSAQNVEVSRVFTTVGGNTISSCTMTSHPALNTTCFNFFAGTSAGKNTSTGTYNFFMGREAGFCNTGGNNNNFIGTLAGYNNLVGSRNNFFGNNAGYNNTTGDNNNFLGSYTGFLNSSGSYNNFIGFEAGKCNTTGGENNLIGSGAGLKNTFGCNNNIMGSSAGRCNTTGSFNTFFGTRAGLNNCTGKYNTFIGAYSGFDITTGSDNIVLGKVSSGLSANTSNVILFATGNIQRYCYSAATGNTTILGNIISNGGTFFGSGAGLSAINYCNVTVNRPAANILLTGDVTGSANAILTPGSTVLSIAATIAPNSVTLGTDTTGNYVATVLPGTGMSASGTADEGNVITLGLTNTAVGAGTYGNANVVAQITFDAQGRATAANNVEINKVFTLLQGNTISSCGMTSHPNLNTNGFNFFAGQLAGACNTTGSNNFFAGRCAGYLNNLGSCNIFIGNSAGYNSGCYNDGFGGYCRPNHNVFLGNFAGYCNVSGCNNVLIGNFAGQGVTADNNFFVGSLAGRYTSTGSNNIFFGYQAGRQTTGGLENIFMGFSAGLQNTTGGCNIFLGTFAGFCNTTGCNNFFAGCCAGRLNTSGYNNIFLGLCAGNCNKVGHNNIFIGTSAGCRAEGFENIYIGSGAGRCNTVGGQLYIGHGSGAISNNTLYNVFLGHHTGKVNTSGSYNTFLGDAAGYKNTTGCHNTFVGTVSGCDNLSGSFSTYVGSYSGAYTAGSCNTALGYRAGQCGSSATNNISIGVFSGAGGTENIFIGTCAGISIPPITWLNTVVGSCAGYTLGQTCYNSFFGGQSGYATTTGRSNSFFGYRAGFCNTTGCCNAFFGHQTGLATTTGAFNTLVGANAGRCNTIGCDNTFIGYCAGLCNTTGNNNIIAGKCSGVGSFGLVNATTQSNTIIIGNTDIANFYTKMAAKAWACTTVKWDATTYEMAADTSSRRFKTDIRPFCSTVDDVLKIESVRYKAIETPEGNDQVGFIAEQIDEIGLKEFVAYDKDDMPLSVSYDRMTALLVNAVKDLSNEVKQLKQEIADIKKSL